MRSILRNVRPHLVPLEDASNTIFFVKDANGCLASSEYRAINLCDNSNLSLSVNLMGNSAEAVATNGTPQYLFSLNSMLNFAPQNVFNSLESGTHTIYVKDSNGCTSNSSFTIDEPESNLNHGTVMDIDGSVYKTVKIGGQIWMADNCISTKYANSNVIPYITDNTQWGNLGDNNTDKAYCFYNNDASLGYGALYTYAAAVNGTPQSGTNKVQGVCPSGWHLLSDAEWTILENYLIANGYNYEGTPCGDKTGKSLASTTGWKNSDETGDVGNHQSTNNATGYSALPGGTRDDDGGAFDSAGGIGNWWSGMEGSNSNAYYRYLYDESHGLGRGGNSKSFGFSVRCVKDAKLMKLLQRNVVWSQGSGSVVSII